VHCSLYLGRSLREVNTASSRQSLLALRNLTVGLWFLFPVIYLAAHANMLTLAQEEWLWTVSDFLGKVIFSTSLLQVCTCACDQERGN
jgi:bacteriorhodopsin